MAHGIFPEDNLRIRVLNLFPTANYWHFQQVPLGRKKIDLVCVERIAPHESTSIELKIRDWRKALWQAAVNLQLSHRSYIALWHRHINAAQRESELLRSYGVGLICVLPDTAELVFESSDPIRRLSRDAKRDWYKQMVAP